MVRLTLLNSLQNLLDFLLLIRKWERKWHECAARLTVFAVYNVNERDFGRLLQLGFERIDHLSIDLDLLLLLILLALLHAIGLGALLLLLLLDVFRHCDCVGRNLCFRVNGRLIRKLCRCVGKLQCVLRLVGRWSLFARAPFELFPEISGR